MSKLVFFDLELAAMLSILGALFELLFESVDNLVIPVLLTLSGLFIKPRDYFNLMMY